MRKQHGFHLNPSCPEGQLGCSAEASSVTIMHQDSSTSPMGATITSTHTAYQIHVRILSWGLDSHEGVITFKTEVHTASADCHEFVEQFVSAA